MAELAGAFNKIVAECDARTKEFVRVRKVIGQQGKLSERASAGDAKGSWSVSIDAVNMIIDDLVRPTTEVGRVIEAVAEGDLSQKMAMEIEGQPVKGDFLRMGKTVNSMLDQLRSFADEVTRVAREVGTDGKLGGQADVKGVSGTWWDLTENVNFMASNLTNQVRNIALVTTAVAKGDLSQKITVDAKGEILALKNTINTMVDQLSSFAAEVTRVAREVGTEGKLGGQAEVKGVSGTWRDLTENVNYMAGNLTDQVRNIAQVATAISKGDLSKKITVDAKGEVAALTDTINSMTDTLRIFAEQVTGVAREVGTDGKLGGQADVPGVAGTWKDLTDNVNFMASNLTDQVRSIALVTTAVAEGDLSQKITVDAKGEILALKSTINTMVDQLSSFADEVTRVAQEVGTEGKLGGQAEVKGVSGTWRGLTENVNQMASNLTTQVRNIAQVTTAVARGDLSQKITVDAKGEVATLADTINSMTDTLRIFAEQVTGVAREVGTEGKLGGQADVPGVAGTWKDLTDNVNFMASNLTTQVRNIAQVATAISNGDLSKKITVDAKGEVATLADTINSMTDTLRIFAEQVTGVAREVGTDGKLGGQADVPGVAGTWKDLTESVNYMASNLTAQVREILTVTTAVANGDLSQTITVDVKGEVLELKNTINTMVDQLSSFADEVTRVAQEVGTEGKLGGQADVKGVSGTWRGLTDSVNFMASNLTTQVRNIAQVATAVAKGDLSQKITVETQGEVAALTTTINTMVDQLSSFADEVTRVAREVGTEGKLAGQAEVKGVSGTWRGLTENVNFMATNLTDQVRNIAQVTTAVANGDLSKKITVDARGEILELKETINVMVDQLSSFADEVTRVTREVGTEGKLGVQAEVKGVSGAWRGLTDNVNVMASNLTDQVRNTAQVATAVAKGDLSQKITVEAQGEVAALTTTINTMVDQLSSFADEVTRVTKQVGTEGKLGVQAEVKGVSGAWRGLTDNVNLMASNLTDQVRSIAQVTTAVANGDLSKKITVDAKGEIMQLKETVNTMVDQLSSFAAEVTRVAKEVGTEGKLGGQAEVIGVSGTWKGLTDNVNQLAGNLTTQVRAIAEVSTAVTQGDLTRSITVEAQGEVSDLKDNLNQMISNLRATTKKSGEQDWLKSNLARISGLMQGQRDLAAVTNLIMSELTPVVSAQHGAFFLAEVGEAEASTFKLLASYGYKKRKNLSNTFTEGEGLVGQSVLEKKPILITQAPDDYIKISSGLGEASPQNIIVLPVVFEDRVLAVIELASFRPFSEVNQTFLEQLTETIGVTLNSIIASMRTEELLEQSQSLAQELQSQSEELQTQQDDLKNSNSELEQQARSLKNSEELLQSQQEELQQTNEELEEKARLLAEQNRNIETKNEEIETAKLVLEERAQQLALSSRYKSEFLANMSHELRTPLNSLLILAKLLTDNPDRNLTDKQVEFASTIHGAGSDLLRLINDILDLSKVEAGKMDLTAGPVEFTAVQNFLRRSFTGTAEQKGLNFEVAVGESLPPSFVTDEQRLLQVLKNLLSNAFKFTETGGVSVRMDYASAGMSFKEDFLNRATSVYALSVSDTGIGMAPDKLRLIFEAFQQADGTTSRRYGGTGLGLSISREIARLLSGEVSVASVEGEGSTFTLYLPAALPQGEPGDAQQEPDGSSSRGGQDASAPVASPGTISPGTTSATTMSPPTPGTTREAGPQNKRGAGSAGPQNKRAGNDPAGEDLLPGDRVLLVVAADKELSATAAEAAEQHAFKVVVAERGGEGLALAHQINPDAILLDLQLPLVDGMVLTDHLKSSPNTRHIPIHATSALDQRQEAFMGGAASFSEQPVTVEALETALKASIDLIEHRPKQLLLIEDDEATRTAITELLGITPDVVITAVGSSAEAIEQLSEHHFNCMVLDLKLVDMNGLDLLEELDGDSRFRNLPVIIHTGKDLTQEEETSLKKYAEAIIIKTAASPERLLAETTLYLHLNENALPSDKRQMLEELHDSDSLFHGKKILVVDDDVRNLFALAATLEARGMDVTYAENGKQAIATLKRDDHTDLVLMDIMMPEMDGYEAMTAIRAMPEFAELPVIALTAKAMQGDREKTIAAGASDYITKPVDTDQLLSLMRVWLYR
ncbi:MAG: HAMP domain-containing protein [Actinobacteria bacterium]|nr:HAMP domain-containing protein [Actinomycetota bacterium]